MALMYCFVVLALSIKCLVVQAVAHEVPQKNVERRAVEIPIADFTLVDQNSREFQFSKLTGRVVVVAFAYTTCPDVCPLITAALRQVQSGLTPDEHKKVFLLTITTDPEIDAPKVLAGYGKRYGADFANWSFLSGDQAALQIVWKNFGVGVKRKARGLVDHTPLIAVVDRKSKMRVVYVGATPNANMVLDDVRRLVKQ
ncbi:MAG TPA: SCO family protein [Candidatus Binatia bacterium]|nr:SCO family protein [Candidatus Binatia bacterium]